MGGELLWQRSGNVDTVMAKAKGGSSGVGGDHAHDNDGGIKQLVKLLHSHGKKKIEFAMRKFTTKHSKPVKISCDQY